jgi:SAM-dependent methyltransferase
VSPQTQQRAVDEMDWNGNSLSFRGLVFRVEDEPTLYGGEKDTFVLRKSPAMIEMFDRFWSLHSDFQPQRVFELGMWDGGSTAFWFEYFRPEKLVAIDRLDREDSPYFERFRTERGLDESLATYWSTDQGDSGRLREIVNAEFDGPLDLVLDDASHMYGPTRASFETLFPYLRPGGLYVIEDWTWEFFEGFRDPSHPWAGEKGLASLVFELAALVGRPTIVASVTILNEFIVAERGDADLPIEGFTISEHVPDAVAGVELSTS